MVVAELPPGRRPTVRGQLVSVSIDARKTLRAIRCSGESQSARRALRAETANVGLEPGDLILQTLAMGYVLLRIDRFLLERHVLASKCSDLASQPIVFGADVFRFKHK